jgi:hypothetical protein
MKPTTLHILVIIVLSTAGIRSFAQTPGPRTVLNYDAINDYVSGTTGISQPY